MNVPKTKESQLRASRNYRLRNTDKVKATCREYSRHYYSDHDTKEKHRKRMFDYYYKKKAEKLRKAPLAIPDENVESY